MYECSTATTKRLLTTATSTTTYPFAVGGDKMERKIQLIGLLCVVVLAVTLVQGVITVNAYPNYDRTDNLGILIAAWTMDDHGITLADCKAMIDDIYARKGVTFEAVKITYGYDPDAHTASYVAGRIDAWVNYFDDYFDIIYVASRTVFHAERKLTTNERNTFYSLLADSFDNHPAVKCFLGEEEPEAKQVDPYTGDPEGNNLAYSSWSDM